MFGSMGPGFVIGIPSFEYAIVTDAAEGGNHERIHSVR
jgi:hypothetical protein